MLKGSDYLETIGLVLSRGVPLVVVIVAAVLYLFYTYGAQVTQMFLAVLAVVFCTWVLMRGRK